MTAKRLVRWIGFATAFAGLLCVLLAMTASPWLRVVTRGQVLGIRFSLVQDLVTTGNTANAQFPTPTTSYFQWAGWILLGVLTIGAVLSGLNLPHTEVIAAITAVGAIATVVLLIAACRPLESPGVQLAVGVWIAGLGYLLLAVAAVLGAASRWRPHPKEW